ncbi:2Fe-2S iron-sulfur cluster binding domain-containing protein [Stappia sp. GBMRC 2046]|uniref:2Fe-2S iron-sulfur cluster binding domain-containing protein n=1 Tax=Stappia sediminis TaxID=2692190 RepID=A0A7X3S7X4_9HYPH|nr:adenylate/guanylate cyclase domain-containing protein [Stappia sediminis]MXN65248.1 2Fe-2S iron-sulfur cluster binding domain-containing protein [Stappia sediminis]
MLAKVAARRRERKGPAGSGSLEQRLRLASGLVLVAFVLLHFLNHALGNISFGAMQAGQDFRYMIWHSTAGTGLLYGALAIHAGLALWKTARRGTLIMPKWEALQLFLGLSIPFLLIRHIMNTRGAEVAFATYVDYRHVLSGLWPDNALLQSVLLLIVWIHGMIGLHYWLRLYDWYRSWQPAFLVLAGAIPLLALTGWISAARRLHLVDEDKSNFKPGEQEALAEFASVANGIVYGLIGLCLAFIAGRKLWKRYGGRISIAFAGERAVRSPPGPTLLEIGRMNRVPMMSVCGGRGRCSTCRTMILEGGETLDPPSAAEQSVLKRIHAGENVRLACQVRPRADLLVRPLILPGKPLPAAAFHDRYRWGVERQIGVMFIDMRGFTRLTESRLAFDVVFILNRYIDGVVKAIRADGGMVDKVMGDGVMALYGVNTNYRSGLRQALSTIVRLAKEIEAINQELEGHLGEPLRIGIGLHGGPSILGRIGLDGRGGVESGLTALGDVVNVASRLENATKDNEALAIVSNEVLEAAGIAAEEIGEVRELAVRGRSAPLKVFAIHDVAGLETSLGSARRERSGGSAA